MQYPLLFELFQKVVGESQALLLDLFVELSAKVLDEDLSLRSPGDELDAQPLPQILLSLLMSLRRERGGGGGEKKERKGWHRCHHRHRTSAWLFFSLSFDSGHSAVAVITFTLDFFNKLFVRIFRVSSPSPALACLHILAKHDYSRKREEEEEEKG